MKNKKWFVLLIAAVMAIGMTFVMTGCGEESSDEEEQVTEAAEEATEAPEEVAQAVDEYVNLAGEYQDEVSQRATATVIANTEAQSVNITVTWGISATEESTWTMDAVKEGNKLVYSNCVRRDLIYSDDTDEPGTGDDEVGGGAEETVVYEGGSGSFEISGDGKLLWTGASDADCQSCVFVRVTE